MRFRYPLYAALVTLAVFVFGCADQNVEDDFIPIGNQPRIRVLDYAPDTVVQLQDSLVIMLNVVDEDGDVGYANPDTTSIFVLDERLESSTPYWLPILENDSTGNAVDAVYTFKLKPFFLLEETLNFETTTLSIQVMDHLGNRSNSTIIGPITILRE